MEDFRPDSVHIATEGPLGLAARSLCVGRRIAFTTSFHTRFPEYIHARFRAPISLGYRWLRWFHGPAERVMVATGTLVDELTGRGFRNVVKWSRGVDAELFRPYGNEAFDFPRPILLYVGRVAVEKNIEAFLRLDAPGTKVVVGDGPQLSGLSKRFPDARFVGYRQGEALARAYSAADVFVFPSRTDTFGLVLLEALACGVPVAAFPVPGPRDVINGSPVGALDTDLGSAVRQALSVDRDSCRQFALAFSWRNCAALFRSHLAPVGQAA